MTPEGKRYKSASGNRDWQNVPIVYWNANNRQLNANVNWTSNANPNYAVVVRRDCSR